MSLDTIGRETILLFVEKSRNVVTCFRALKQTDEKVQLMNGNASPILQVLDQHSPARELMISAFLKKMEIFRWDAQKYLKEMDPLKRKIEQIALHASTIYNRARNANVAQEILSLSLNTLEAINKACQICLNYWLLLECAIKDCDPHKVLEETEILENMSKTLKF